MPNNPKIILTLLLFFLNSISSIQAQSNNDSLDFFESKLKQSHELPLDSVLYFYDRLCDIVPAKDKLMLLRRKAHYLLELKQDKIAERVFIQAVNLSEKDIYKNQRGHLFHDVGVFYYDRYNDYSSAYDYFLKAKDVFEKTKNKKSLILIKENIATLLSDEGRLEEAEILFEETLEYYKVQKDTLNILYARLNLANILRSKKIIQIVIRFF